MYISCPECDTKFVVNPEQIGSNGRKVKCSKCSHIWHQRLNENIKIEPILTPAIQDTPPLGNGVNLPALLPVKIPVYLYSMPFLFIVMILIMFMAMFPQKFGFDTMLANNDMSIKDIQIDNRKDLEKLTVSYKVLNSSEKAAHVPLVRVRLFDKNNRILKSYIVDKREIDLSPKQYVLIKTEFVPAPPSTESLDIMIGNKLDFILR